ncbi:hypothetical protein EVAR_69804_1 [Eumeta japonica]|uniref:Uncharacterized protein n=1 Tax=Eumeta variegata TaxID=151549 RepID=A0A4C1Z5Z7_EUMVA|nr:hypothetical protein EVAR_69804_1 [Eumeta japonica]
MRIPSRPDVRGPNWSNPDQSFKVHVLARVIIRTQHMDQTRHDSPGIKGETFREGKPIDNIFRSHTLFRSGSVRQSPGVLFSSHSDRLREGPSLTRGRSTLRDATKRPHQSLFKAVLVHPTDLEVHQQTSGESQGLSLDIVYIEAAFADKALHFLSSMFNLRSASNVLSPFAKPNCERPSTREEGQGSATAASSIATQLPTATLRPDGDVAANAFRPASAYPTTREGRKQSSEAALESAKGTARPVLSPSPFNSQAVN